MKLKSKEKGRRKEGRKVGRVERGNYLHQGYEFGLTLTTQSI